MNRLIIGLGNPGKEYEWTRHNIGVQAVKAYVEVFGLKLHVERGCLAYIARSEDEKGKIYIAYLMTFMNESGKAVERVVRFLNIDACDMLVVFDDIEMSWGNLRVVSTGGTRGHNGIRSIQNHLKTKGFYQLRIGVGRPGGKDIAGYVLDRFNVSEMGELPSLFEETTEKIREWLLIHERNIEL